MKKFTGLLPVVCSAFLLSTFFSCGTTDSAKKEASEQEEIEVSSVEKVSEQEPLPVEEAPSDAEKEQPVVQNEPPVQKLIGAEGIEQPDWLVQPQFDKEGVYQIGSAKMTRRDTSIKAAQATARSSISLQLEPVVKALVRSCLENKNLTEEKIASYEKLAVQKNFRLLRGLTQRGYWIGPEGEAYVQMFLPYSYAVPEFNKILQETLGELGSGLNVSEEVFAQAVANEKTL